ncbi:hypothetical protein [Lactococcus fujiensis]|uniref:Lipoprotein n=1 Tax=Lactococcus fujiensis JCM 16395 TaxID=1291764 RepID=A0A2A5RJ72_9LACT|nr:hypothetical protein [Lactococcus fujiensis]PCR99159.1 hypothetical protein RT41_GL000460 [Lactococcus fujiensis JCM 16395]
MKKTRFLLISLFCIVVLSSCSDKNSASSKSNPNDGSSSSKSVLSSSKVKTEESISATTLFSGYSEDQIEYARVTEAIIHYYKGDYQPVSIEVTKNGQNHHVFPYKGSITIPEDTVTLSFSYDNTMAGTTNITYHSNQNGSIKFYKNPNHYQDERYLNDPTWVNEESKKLLNSSQTLEIPLTYDKLASQIISLINIK